MAVNLQHYLAQPLFSERPDYELLQWRNIMSHQKKRPLKVGLFLPIIEDCMAGQTARWSDLLAMAQRAEAVGFDSLWLPDHLLYAFGDTTDPPHGVWECWSLLAALAASTTRVELGTLVTCTSFRNPALLAKMADTVDEISGGRLILGLGAGYHELEFHAFGYALDHLVGRFEEAITIIHGLLRARQIDFVGQYYQARGCELRPRGPRPNGPPILIGTIGQRMLRLTARFADMWNAWSVNQVASIPPLRDAVDAACREVGRDPATLERTVTVMVDLPGSTNHPQAGWVREFRAATAPPATDSVEALANLLRTYAAEGINQVQVYVQPTTVAGVEAFAPVLDLLDRGEDG
jgi:alkanesulfonate monooxygenase SsuD/methylene tetrahydromethanopterin reductase-like flavin-dependent oxidoreductase (luciferase family)